MPQKRKEESRTEPGRGLNLEPELVRPATNDDMLELSI